MATKASVLAAHSEGQRRFYRFSDNEYSNCNLYAFAGARAISAAESFRSGGQFAKKPLRLVMAVGGVALALMLILALDAVVGGMEAKLTAYIDYSGADIFVAQSGVRNMHMAASALPLSVKSQVRAVPGVATVTPVLYLTNVVVSGGNRHLAYVIGLPPKAVAGGPWRIVAGKALPGTREAIIDRGVAEQSGIGLGDTVKILGEEFTVAGLSEGTANLTNSVAFM